MKRIYKNVCQWLLSVLGIGVSVASCAQIKVVYGQPYMEYSAKGKVVDAETGKGVEGIVVMHEDWEHHVDTTDSNGNFYIYGRTFPQDSLKVRIFDSDSTSNGEYANKDVFIPLKQVKKSSKWFRGGFKAKDAVIEVKKKNL